jgi:hypothetical protein
MLNAIHASACAGCGGGALDAADAAELASSETERIAVSRTRACRMGLSPPKTSSVDPYSALATVPRGPAARSNGVRHLIKNLDRY